MELGSKQIVVEKSSISDEIEIFWKKYGVRIRNSMKRQNG